MPKNNENNSLMVKTAAIALLTAFGCATQISEDSFSPSSPSKLYMTPETHVIYGKYAEFIADQTPNLKILIITDNDLKFSGTDKDRSIALARAVPCTPPPESSDEDRKSSEEAMSAARREIKKLIDGFSREDGPNALIRRSDLEKIDIQPHITGISLRAVGNAASTFYLSTELPEGKHSNEGIAIVSMPGRLKTLKENIELFSTLPAAYIENIQSTPEDWALFTLAHEISGHVAHAHNIENPPGYCEKPDYDWSSKKIRDETLADIKGIQIFKKAQKKGLASPAPLEREVEAMRALWTLYYNRNVETVSHSAHLGVHSTAQGFDPSAARYKGALLGKHTAGTAEIPLIINLAADVVTGFVHSRYIKEDMAAHPENYTEKQKKEYENVPTSPQYIPANIKAFASLGMRVRMQRPRNPEWHYESLSFLKEIGVFDDLMDALGKEEAETMKDILDDFFRSADTYAPKLKNPEFARQIRQALPQEHLSIFRHAWTYGKGLDSLPTSTPLPEAPPPGGSAPPLPSS